MTDAPIHLIHGRLLTVLCGAEEITAAVVWVANADTSAATCETCIKRAPANQKREEERARLLARTPQPRQLRATDTLGKAGRIRDDGKPVKVERKRDMIRSDLRRLAMDAGAGAELDPDLVITEAQPLRDEKGEPLPVVAGDDHRGLQHLDGQSEPRPPREWEDALAEQRTAAFSGDRERMTREARKAFASMPLPKRLERVVQEVTALQTPKAQVRRETDARSAVEGDRAPQGEGSGAVGYLDPHLINRYLQQIDLYTEAIFDALLAHWGHGVKDVTMMTKEEKDALILHPKHRGLSNAEINARYGDAIGKASTIGKVRSEAGQDGRGNPKLKVEAA